MNHARLLIGDVCEQLATLADGSVDCVVTSPPYWGLRDYGTGAWEGGDPGCDHMEELRPSSYNVSFNERWGNAVGDKKQEERGKRPFKDVCGKCGARRIDNQIGLEATPDQYVQTIVGVFREVRRVLAAHGTCWVNMGDSYASQGARGDTRTGFNERYFGSGQPGKQAETAAHLPTNVVPDGLKPKDLVGIPWRVALALQADGWYLRSDVIWAKPNPMPESVTDRPTKAHEYVFLLTKRPRYFYDADAVREPHSPDGRSITTVMGGENSVQHRNGERWPGVGRNLRTVWNIPTHPYPDAHFATYPPALVERCVKAGCPKWVCTTCGKPRERIVETDGDRWAERVARGEPSRHGNSGIKPSYSVGTNSKRDLGWTDCGHDTYRRGLVLDPFLGSGTTSVIALRNHLDTIGIELNPEYAELARRRLAKWWEDPTSSRDNTNTDQLVLIDELTPTTTTKGAATPRNDGDRWNQNDGRGF